MKRPVAVDTNLLISLYKGRKISEPYGLKQFRKLERLINEGRTLEIFAVQVVECAEDYGRLVEAQSKGRLSDNQELQFVRIETLISKAKARLERSAVSAHELKELLLIQSDGPELRSFKYADLMIAYLAKRNGCALISQEKESRPIQHYIKKHELSP